MRATMLVLSGTLCLSFVSSREIRATELSCEEKISHLLLEHSEITTLLKSEEFWTRFQPQHLLRNIDPINRSATVTADHIFEAFGRNPRDPRDRKALQKEIELLGRFFSAASKSSLSSEELYGLSLPAGALEVVKTNLFRDERHGASKFRILSAFISHYVLKRGSPEDASNTILGASPSPTQKERLTVSDEALRTPKPKLLSYLLHPFHSLSIVRARTGYFLERLGRGKIVPALLRPTMETYFIYGVQYQTDELPKKPLFTDLPESFKKIALEGMSAAERLPERLNASAHSDVQNLSSIATKSGGDWTASFLSMITKFAYDHRVTILGPDAEHKANFSNDEWDQMIKGSLSARDYWVYQQGMGNARYEWQKEVSKQQGNLRRVIYADPEEAYQELRSARQGVRTARSLVSSEAADWSLEGRRRRSLVKDQIRMTEAEWSTLEQAALRRFAIAALRAHMLSELVGIQMDPRHIRAFEKDPSVFLAAVRALHEAEDAQTTESRAADLENFRKSLRPEIAQLVFSPAANGVYPLGRNIIESLKARNWKEKSTAYLGAITKTAGILTAGVLILGTLQTFKKPFERPPISESQVFRLVHSHLNAKDLISDPNYRLAKEEFIASAIADGLSPEDERLLQDFLKRTEPEEFPARLRWFYESLRNSNPDDPMYADFDWFSGWRSKNSLNLFGNDTARALEEKRAHWLSVTLDAMRFKLSQDLEIRRAEAARLSEEAQNWVPTTKPTP